MLVGTSPHDRRAAAVLLSLLILFAGGAALLWRVDVREGKRMAQGLGAEATHADGIVEAVSVRDAKTFALGTQWHPEFKALNNPDSVKLFTAFGNAVRAYAKARGKPMRAIA